MASRKSTTSRVALRVGALRVCRWSLRKKSPSADSVTCFGLLTAIRPCTLLAPNTGASVHGRAHVPFELGTRACDELGAAAASGATRIGKGLPRDVVALRLGR